MPQLEAAGRLRRWVGLPLLLIYSLLLGLAALVPEIRPAFLDRPHAVARGALELLGIRAGHVLMRATYPGDYRFQSYCMIVRGEGAPEPPVFLFPPEGECPNSGLRPRLPPVERALYRMLRGAWWEQIQAEREHAPAPANHRLRVRTMLSRIGRHFCTRPEMAGRTEPRISFAWYVYEVSYADGHLRRGNFLHFGWLCEPEILVRETWFPSDQALVRFWGSEPWGDPPWQ